MLKAKGILFTTAFLTVVSGSVKTDTIEQERCA